MFLKQDLRSWRPRSVAMTSIVGALAAGLALAPSALAGADPLSGGTTVLAMKLPKGVSVKASGGATQVAAKSVAAPITGGALDPTTGAGTENLTGAMTFKFSGHSTKVTGLSATFGPGGALKGTIGGKSKTIATIGTGAVGRAGFGGQVSSAPMKITKAGANALNAKLESDDGVKPFKPNKGIGAASTVTVPTSVEVVSGTASLQVAPAGVAKLAARGVNPLHGGISPNSPASIDPATGTLSFPVTGGSISPNGSAGRTTAAGGATIKKTDAVSAGCDATHPVGVSIATNNIVADFDSKQIIVDVTLPTSPIPAPGQQFGTFTVTSATSDPTARTITVTATSSIGAASAFALNSVFGTAAEGCGTSDSVAGDPLGTLTVSVTTH